MAKEQEKAINRIQTRQRTYVLQQELQFKSEQMRFEKEKELKEKEMQ